jgi:hypothetical protein
LSVENSGSDKGKKALDWGWKRSDRRWRIFDASLKHGADLIGW